MGAKTLLSHTGRIAWKDLTELFRNRLGLVLLILMPLFMMVMVGFIYPSTPSISNVPVAIVNQDSGFNNSTIPSQTFLLAFQIANQKGYFAISNASSVSDVKDLFQKGELQGCIVIPSNFSQSVSTGQQGTLLILTDQSNPQMSAIVQSALANIVNGIGTNLAAHHMVIINSALNSTNALAEVQPYTTPPQPSTNYFTFVAPGIMAMTVMMSVMTGLPVAISQEKEVGTMDGMMVAPINRLSIILGKTLGQTARGLIQGIIILVLAVGIFGATIEGSILLVFGLLLLGVFSFVGLGIVITSFTKDQETAQMLMMTLMFPMMFLSGVFFPTAQMPWFMQDIAKFLPLTYASDALRKVMVLGAGVSQISTQIIVLLVFGVVMIGIAVPVFRRMMTR